MRRAGRWQEAQQIQAHAVAEGYGGSGEEVRLYVGNLSYNTNENSLRSQFEAYGTITDVFLPVDRTSGRLRGFGFVAYGNRDDAQRAIFYMNDTNLDGRIIIVNESRPRGGGGWGSGGGGGFDDGRRGGGYDDRRGNRRGGGGGYYNDDHRGGGGGW